MTARINTVIGRYWGGMVRVNDILYALAVFGALGGLPPLLHVVEKCARYAMTSLRAPLPRAVAARPTHPCDTCAPPSEGQTPST